MKEGHRRYVGSEVGDEYQRILAFEADTDFSDPDLADRTLGDMIDPSRTASATTLLNLVSRHVETDCAEWSIYRLRDMARQIKREAQEKRKQRS